MHERFRQNQVYRKTPNKRPWAFASLTDLKRAFPAFSSFLRNENRTIYGWDIAKNVKKDQVWGLSWGGGAIIGRGRLLGVLWYVETGSSCFPINSMWNDERLSILSDFFWKYDIEVSITAWSSHTMPPKYNVCVNTLLTNSSICCNLYQCQHA